MPIDIAIAIGGRALVDLHALISQPTKPTTESSIVSTQFEPAYLGTHGHRWADRSKLLCTCSKIFQHTA